MKKSLLMLSVAAALICTLQACNDNSEIGASIVEDQISVVVDSAFTVSGTSQVIDKVQSRTISQLLGRIDAKGYGSLTSDVVTQFMPSSQIETEGVVKLDSLMLYMYMAAGEFVGDSLAPMGVEVYRLNELLPSPIYSDFNPEGMYDPVPLASKVYNTANESADTIMSSFTGLQFAIEMPDALATELYDAYKANPDNFASPTAFTENVFKGLYIKNSYGSGRLLRITSTMMSLYYDYYDSDADSTYVKVGNYFAVTPEIVCNNDVTLEISQDIKDRVADGETIVMAPVGMDVKMRFPAPEILASYYSKEADLRVLNSVSFSLPAQAIENENDFPVPTYLLMVLESEKDSFFADNKLPDNTTSFYATYDSDDGVYTFGDMRAYINTLIAKDNITEEDYTFALIPVSATFESSSSSSYYYYYYGYSQQTLSMLTPYMASPVLGRLCLDQAKIKLTYSTQSVSK